MRFSWPGSIAAPVGVDLGQRFIKLAQRTGGGVRRALVDAPSWMREDPEKLTGARRRELTRLLRAAMNEASMRGREAALLLPRRCVWERHLHLAPMPAAELSQAVHWQVAQQMQSDPAGIVSDLIHIGEHEREGSRQTDVIGYGVALDVAEGYVEAVIQSGCRVRGIDAPGAALARGVGGRGGTEEETILLDIGWGGSLLLVVSGARVRFARQLSFGVREVERGVAERMDIQVAEARQYLEQPGDDAAEGGLFQTAALEAAAFLADQLAREITMSIHHYTRTFRRGRPASGGLSGGGARLPGLIERLREQSGLAWAVAVASDDVPEACMAEGLSTGWSRAMREASA